LVVLVKGEQPDGIQVTLLRCFANHYPIILGQLLDEQENTSINSLKE